ncbi:MAG: hypothetical protein C0476_07415 [Sphingomonas sp.]|nr:hypothetical protein [Sphingomonas sp.]
MRTLLILATLAATPAVAREAPQRALGQPDCRSAAAQRAQTPPRAGARPLNQMPDPALIRAVDYREGGCSKPVAIGRVTRR